MQTVVQPEKTDKYIKEINNKIELLYLAYFSTT